MTDTINKYFGLPCADEVEHFFSDNTIFKTIKDYCLSDVIDKIDNENVKKALSYLNDFLSGMIFFQQLEKFNDPFEPMVFIDAKFFDSTFRSKVKHAKSLSERFRIIQYSKAANQTVIINYSEKWGKAYGVACFSKYPLNQLMWAHYACSGMGVCAEYEIADELNDCYKSKGEITTLIPALSEQSEKRIGGFFYGAVNYKDIPIIIDDHVLDTYKFIAKKYHDSNNLLSCEDVLIASQIFQKPKCWEYEGEFRVVMFGSSGLFPVEYLHSQHQTSLIKLKKIFLGWRILKNPLLKKLVINTCKQRKLSYQSVGFEGASFDLGLYKC